MAAHFTDEALSFLVDLEQNNERSWFTPRKPLYEATLKAPMLALIDELNDALEAFAPDYLRPPEKAMFRIYRDVRFSKDKAPYKTHVGALWPRQDQEKLAGAALYLQVSPTGVLVAGGCYQPGAPQLAAIRDHLLSHHADLTAILDSLERTGLAGQMDGSPLSRPPRGYPADHPAIELIKYRRWAASSALPASAALQPGLAGLVADRFRALMPLVDFLNVAVHDAARAAPAPRS